MNKTFRILVIVLLILAVGGFIKVTMDKQKKPEQETVTENTGGNEEVTETTEEVTEETVEEEEEERPEAIEIEEDGEVEIIVPEDQEEGGF